MAAGEFGEPGGAVLDGLRDDVDDVFGGLQPAGHGDQAGAEDDGAELLVDLGPDHDIGDAGFILQGHEDHAAGAARALADEDEARDGEAALRLQPGQGDIGPDIGGPQPFAQEADRVPLQ